MRKLLLTLCLLLVPICARTQIPPVVGILDTLVAKATPGTLLDGYVSVSAAGYLYIFNQTTAPTNGSYTAGVASGNYQDCLAIEGAGTYGLSSFGIPGEKFSAGIALAWSSSGCGTLTLSSGTILFVKARVQ